MRAWVYDRSIEGSLITGVLENNIIYLEQRDVPIPQIRPNTILGRVVRTSVCGSDIPLITGQYETKQDNIIPGHEMCIEVVDKHREVIGREPGTLLAVESHYDVPGEEDEGIIGLWGPKAADGVYLRPMNGAWAEYVLVMNYCTHEIPREMLDDFCPSLLEASGNDYLIAKYLKDQGLMRDVAVVGCGQHGLYTQLFARHMGCENLAAFEINHAREVFARNYGQADLVLNPLEYEGTDLEDAYLEFTNGNRFQCVVDIAGKGPDTFGFCSELVREGGTLVLFGLYEEDRMPEIRDEDTGQTYKANDIIFRQLEFPAKLGDKRVRIKGLTGREGIWDALIELAVERRDIRAKMMELVHEPLESLDHLLQDLTNPTNVLRKLAYSGFR